jgi:hypothetical protein
MKQVKKVRADRVVVGLDGDALAVVGKMIPVEKHRGEAGEESVGDVAGAGLGVGIVLRKAAPEGGDAGAEDIHRVGRGGQGFERGEHGGGQAAEGAELDFVGFELLAGWERSMDQQVRDLLEFAVRGEVEDVVAAVV